MTGPNAKHKSIFKKLSRWGYFSRGIVYVFVAYFAGAAALVGGPIKNSKESMASIPGFVFGEFILAGLALGLAGYSIWRFVQAVWDVDDHGESLKGLGIRAGLFVSSLTHGLMCAFAVKVLLDMEGSESASSGSSKGSVLQSIFEHPVLAKTLFIVVGVAVLGAGLAQIYKGIMAKYEKRFSGQPDSMLFKKLCQFGLITRGVSFAVIAFLLGKLIVNERLYESSSTNVGLKDALEYLHQLSYGPLILGVMSLGLLAFAFYSISESFYRDFELAD